ncbi:amino acid racemase [Niallia taxi]|uniref:aspartate/glutamate racemase family protein n=1 Tax=Niallia taxi TaxID=2499688 RepID=UPI0023A91D7A|nr:amino acid racemase [Niallia taxi]MDE5053319.1 amino acid racemase [Niallia taxi]WOD61335.1 amino acid racemase [Niallia taxi]
MIEKTYKNIGIVAVTSEGAALCYKNIVSESMKRIGKNIHPEISLHNVSFSDYYQALVNDDYQKIVDILLYSIKKLQLMGADFAIIPANTIHCVFNEIQKMSPIPLLSILETTSKECQLQKYKKVCVLGTIFTMQGKLYKESFEKCGIDLFTPSMEEQEVINSIIMDELIPGKNNNNSIEKVISIINRVKSSECDAVALACTELPVIINNDNSPLPVLNTTNLLSSAALELAINNK